MTDKNKEQLLLLLPVAIEKVTQSYRGLIEILADGGESKDVSARHAAGKAAIAHLELLLKLGTRLEKESVEEDNEHDQVSLMNMAHQEVAAFDSREKEERD